ncbi:hypothetical protein I6A84_01810 [Frankia sp. CNm7]|uniref:Uncharacterized protein n=1 Tax=Frankia nepalensis TaxID=1836974 RepID=A0A937RK94_9ACTN|nr:hypothetical protein [Frankia nepalensis]MBL7498164.1 hypothetical protein [Frankia nepalensis]MBL7509318.1 hypothetical protein [Frankia nepalensis]MBL7516894.1 hypothetical protein [Frankia nepalensis]MBL7627953.1 hypothetical protein [Frankia nepalensis]
MPGHSPTSSYFSETDAGLTAAELDAARAELACYRVTYREAYAIGVLAAVAEAVAGDRVDQYTRATARRGLALAEVAHEPTGNLPGVA